MVSVEGRAGRQIDGKKLTGGEICPAESLRARCANGLLPEVSGPAEQTQVLATVSGKTNTNRSPCPVCLHHQLINTVMFLPPVVVCLLCVLCLLLCLQHSRTCKLLTDDLLQNDEEKRRKIVFFP